MFPGDTLAFGLTINWHHVINEGPWPRRRISTDMSWYSQHRHCVGRYALLINDHAVPAAN